MANVTDASLQPIYERLHAAPTYHPLEADTFADWSMEAGDIVTITRDGTSYASPVHSSTLVWKKGQQITLTSTGNEKREAVAKVSKRKYRSGGSGLRNSGKMYNYEVNQDHLMYEVWDTDGRFSQIEVNVMGLYHEVMDSDGRVSYLSNTVDGLHHEVYDSDGRVSVLDNTVYGLYHEVMDSTGKVSLLSNTVDGLKHEVYDTDGSFAVLENTSKGLYHEVMDSDGRVSDLSNTVNGLKHEVYDTDGSFAVLENTTKGLYHEVMDSEGRVGVLQVTAKGLYHEVYDTDGSFAVLENTAKGLYHEVMDSDGRVSDLSNTVDGLKHEVYDTDGSFAVLESTAKGLYHEVMDSDGRVGRLQVTAKGLYHEVYDTDGSVATLESTAKGLYHEVMDSDGRVGELEITARGLQFEVYDTHGRVSVLRSDVNGFETSIQGVIDSSGRITAASIKTAINQDTGSNITLEADQINIDGIVTQLETYDIRVEGLIGTYVNVGWTDDPGEFTVSDDTELHTAHSTTKFGELIVAAEKNDQTGEVTLWRGDGTYINFSHAASITGLLGNWSGSTSSPTLQVTTNPDTGIIYKIGFGTESAAYDQNLNLYTNGTPYKDTTNSKQLHVPLKIDQWQSGTPPQIDTRYETELTVNAESVWNAGRDAVQWTYSQIKSESQIQINRTTDGSGYPFGGTNSRITISATATYDSANHRYNIAPIAGSYTMDSSATIIHTGVEAYNAGWDAVQVYQGTWGTSSSSQNVFTVSADDRKNGNARNASVAIVSQLANKGTSSAQLEYFGAQAGDLTNGTFTSRYEAYGYLVTTGSTASTKVKVFATRTGSANNYSYSDPVGSIDVGYLWTSGRDVVRWNYSQVKSESSIQVNRTTDGSGFPFGSTESRIVISATVSYDSANHRYNIAPMAGSYVMDNSATIIHTGNEAYNAGWDDVSLTGGWGTGSDDGNYYIVSAGTYKSSGAARKTSVRIEPSIAKKGSNDSETDYFGAQAGDLTGTTFTSRKETYGYLGLDGTGSTASVHVYTYRTGSAGSYSYSNPVAKLSVADVWTNGRNAGIGVVKWNYSQVKSESSIQINSTTDGSGYPFGGTNSRIVISATATYDSTSHRYNIAPMAGSYTMDSSATIIHTGQEAYNAGWDAVQIYPGTWGTSSSSLNIFTVSADARKNGNARNTSVTIVSQLAKKGSNDSETDYFGAQAGDLSGSAFTSRNETYGYLGLDGTGSTASVHVYKNRSGSAGSYNYSSAVAALSVNQVWENGRAQGRNDIKWTYSKYGTASELQINSTTSSSGKAFGDRLLVSGTYSYASHKYTFVPYVADKSFDSIVTGTEAWMEPVPNGCYCEGYSSTESGIAATYSDTDTRNVIYRNVIVTADNGNSHKFSSRLAYRRTTFEPGGEGTGEKHCVNISFADKQVGRLNIHPVYEAGWGAAKDMVSFPYTAVTTGVQGITVRGPSSTVGSQTSRSYSLSPVSDNDDMVQLTTSGTAVAYLNHGKYTAGVNSVTINQDNGYVCTDPNAAVAGSGNGYDNNDGHAVYRSLRVTASNGKYRDYNNTIVFGAATFTPEGASGPHRCINLNIRAVRVARIDVQYMYDGGYTDGWKAGADQVSFPYQTASTATQGITVYGPSKTTVGTSTSRSYSLSELDTDTVQLTTVYNSASVIVARLAHGQYTKGWKAGAGMNSFPHTAATSTSVQGITVYGPSATTVGRSTSRSYSLGTYDNDTAKLTTTYNSASVIVAYFTHGRYTAGWRASYASVNGQFPTTASTDSTLAVPKPAYTVDATHTLVNYYLDATSDNNKAFIRYNNATNGTKVAEVVHNKYTAGQDSVGWNYTTTTSGLVKINRDLSSGKETFGTGKAVVAYITYSNTTHKYTAQAKFDDQLMNSTESGLDAYNDGWKNGAGYVKFPATAATTGVQGITVYGPSKTTVGTSTSQSYSLSVVSDNNDMVQLTTSGFAVAYLNHGKYTAGVNSVQIYQTNGVTCTNPTANVAGSGNGYDNATGTIVYKSLRVTASNGAYRDYSNAIAYGAATFTPEGASGPHRCINLSFRATRVARIDVQYIYNTGWQYAWKKVALPATITGSTSTFTFSYPPETVGTSTSAASTATYTLGVNASNVWAQDASGNKIAMISNYFTRHDVLRCTSVTQTSSGTLIYTFTATNPTHGYTTSTNYTMYWKP